MKTELFNVFTEKQIQAIKDCLRYGLWGDTDCLFKGDEEPTIEYGYCTSDIAKGRHFKGKEISGICSRISKKIEEEKLNWIEYIANYWDDGDGMIFFHRKRLEATKEELIEWSKS